MPTPPRSRTAAPITATVSASAHDGRGIAHHNGKAVFIAGALPGEAVTFIYQHRHRHYAEGKLIDVLTPAAARVIPPCPHFSVCGGCSLQHMNHATQIAIKQQTLLDNLQRLGKVSPQQLAAPLLGPPWAYRRKARLSVKYDAGSGRVVVGFRARHGKHTAALETCAVLHPAAGEKLTTLAAAISTLQARDRIIEIEIAIGDEHSAWVLRHRGEIGPGDKTLLCELGAHCGVQIYLQPSGPDGATPLWPERIKALSYRLPAYDLQLLFAPTDFIQVNDEINRMLVDRVVDWLQPGPQDRILDLFCGLGNFSLPLARYAAAVTGIDSAAALVRRASENAHHNNISNAHFYTADLDADSKPRDRRDNPVNKIVIDPPRGGALALMRNFPWVATQRIVYVSCHPATLARDAGILVHTHGYQLASAGIVDMFPHTDHVESIALFTR